MPRQAHGARTKRAEKSPGTNHRSECTAWCWKFAKNPSSTTLQKKNTEDEGLPNCFFVLLESKSKMEPGKKKNPKTRGP